MRLGSTDVANQIVIFPKANQADLLDWQIVLFKKLSEIQKIACRKILFDVDQDPHELFAKRTQYFGLLKDRAISLLNNCRSENFIAVRGALQVTKDALMGWSGLNQQINVSELDCVYQLHLGKIDTVLRRGGL